MPNRANPHPPLLSQGRSSCPVFRITRARTGGSWNLVGHSEISAPLNSLLCPLHSDLVQPACSSGIRGPGHIQRHSKWEWPVISAGDRRGHRYGFKTLPNARRWPAFAPGYVARRREWPAIAHGKTGTSCAASVGCIRSAPTSGPSVGSSGCEPISLISHHNRVLQDREIDVA
jgi:hypothetical protein